MNTFLRFPVSLDKADDGVTVTFPDVPEAITHGADEAEALLRAVEALETALEMYTDAGEALPVPGKPARGQRTVAPSAQVAVKLAVYQAMREQGVRKSELARALGWHMPQVDRLLDLRHASKLGAAEAALSALGRELHISWCAVQPSHGGQGAGARTSNGRGEAAAHA